MPNTAVPKEFLGWEMLPAGTKYNIYGTPLYIKCSINRALVGWKSVYQEPYEVEISSIDLVSALTNPIPSISQNSSVTIMWRIGEGPSYLILLTTLLLLLCEKCSCSKQEQLHLFQDEKWYE